MSGWECRNNSLQNLNVKKYAPKIKSTPSNMNDEKKDIVSNNTKKQSDKVNRKHVEKYNQSTLHQAVLSTDLDDIKKILENTLNINLADKLGRTPLHYAAFNSDMESAKLSLAHAANINAVDKSKQWTPLFFSVYMKHEDMVNLLIEEGANQATKVNLDEQKKS